MIIYAINYFMLSTVFFFYKLQPGERTDATTRKAGSRAAICEQRGHPRKPIHAEGCSRFGSTPCLTPPFRAMHTHMGLART